VERPLKTDFDKIVEEFLMEEFWTGPAKLICFVTAQLARNWNSGDRMRKPATRFEDLLVWQKAQP
jgi:hypothetical protein